MEIGDIVIYREEGMAPYAQDVPAIVMRVFEGEEHPNLDLKVFTKQGDFDLWDILYNPDGKTPHTWRHKNRHTSIGKSIDVIICDDKESEPDLSSSIPAEGSGE